MPKTSDLNPKGLNNESFLILGEPGSGKTNLFRHVPKPLYVFDFDNGIKTLAGVEGIEYDVYKDAAYGDPAYPDRGIYKWGEGWKAVRKKLGELSKAFAAGTGPAAVGFDSVTGMIELCKDFVMKEDPSKNDPEKMEIQHWGTLGMQIRYVLDTFTTWPCLKFAMGHVKRDENPLTEAIELVPLLQGQMQGTLPSYFDEIYFADVRTKKVGDKVEATYALTTLKNGLVKAARTRRGVKDGTPTDWREIEKQLVK